VTSLAEGLISVKDFSISMFLPAILIFVLMYAILAKTKVLGENQWINATLSAVVAILFITVVKAVTFTREFLPLISIALVILVFLFIVFRFVGVEGLAAGKGKIFLTLGAGGLVLVLAGVVFKKVFNSAYLKMGDALNAAWQAVSEPEVAAAIVMLSALILAAWLVARSE